MIRESRPSRVLKAALTTALLATALSSVPALAQDTPQAAPKTKTKPAATEAPSQIPVETEVNIDIPDIEATNSTLEPDAIREILSGNVAGYAEQLASLDADNILIPTLTLSYTTTGNEGGSGEVVYRDIQLSDVTDGVAASVSVGGFTMNGMEGNGTGEFGAMTANDFDIGALLGFYGMLEEPDTEFRTVYRNFAFEGGTMNTPEMECAIGAMTGDELRARATSTSFSEMMTVAGEMDAADEEPSPELISRFMAMYADFLTAFESTPVTFEGIDCNGVTKDDAPMSIAVGTITIDGFQPGIYPQITLDGFNVTVEGDTSEAGNFAIDQAVFKSFDFSAQAELLQNVPSDVNATWFDENMRSLIPAFGGFSLSGLSFDIPDPDTQGARIAASVDNFDLTLDNYVNGIPASVDASASNLVINIPQDSEDETIQQLIAAGITSLDLGFNLSFDWDEANETIEVNAINLEGANLGSISLMGTVGNAIPALFSTDSDAATVAGMGLTVQDLTLDMTDAGMVELILNQVGAEQGTNAQTMRPMMAGVAEGMAAGLLGGGEQATRVGSALGTFIRGGEALSLTVTARDEAGVGLAEFMAAQEDPTVLLDRVDIDATAQ